MRKLSARQRSWRVATICVVLGVGFGALVLRGGIAATDAAARSSEKGTSLRGFEPAAASFLNSEQGWVLGQGRCHNCAKLLVTNDGGKSWKALPALRVPLGFFTSPPASVIRVYFADRKNGYLFGPGLELTHDGGRTWTSGALPSLDQVSGNSGYAYALHRDSPVGGVRLWRNAVGSNKWAPVSVPAGASSALASSPGFQLEVEGSTLLLLRQGPPLVDASTSELGALWMSKNGGSGWVKRPVPCATADGGAAVVSITRDHPKAWLLDCYDSEQSSQAQHTQHHLYGSASAGASWVRLGDPSHNGVPALLADNGSGHAFLATESGVGDLLFGSFDGARHWSRLFASGGSFSGWTDLQFVNPSTGFVVGPTHYAPEHLYRTDNGGQTWHVLRIG